MSIESHVTSLVNGHRAMIYTFVNHADKRIQVYYTLSIFRSLERLQEDLHSVLLKDLKKDIESKKAVFHVHTTYPPGKASQREMKVRHMAIVAHYESLGYKPYKEYNNELAKYTFKHEIRYKKKIPYIVAYLESGRKEKIVVGMFRYFKDFKHWACRHYKKGRVIAVYKHESAITNKIFGLEDQ